MSASIPPPDTDTAPGPAHRYASGTTTTAKNISDRAFASAAPRNVPTAATILLGVGLGGFFDGIVFHQLLQWHHMVSSWYPPTTVANLRLNTLWDGIFHSATYVAMVIAVFMLWRSARETRFRWSGRPVAGALLLGWGGFNLVEGFIDHQILALHHVNERVERSAWLYWDMSFLGWGALMFAAGWMLLRTGRKNDARYS